jgi:hypothetical protein
MNRRTTPRRGRRRLPAITWAQLRHANRDLRHQLNGAGHHIADLQAAIADRDARIEELEEQAVQHAAQCEADAVDLSVACKRGDDWEAAHGQLTAEHLAVKAELENLAAVTVPPFVRDTSGPDDHQTEPTYVQVWREQMDRADRQAATPEVKPLAAAFGGVR